MTEDSSTSRTGGTARYAPPDFAAAQSTTSNAGTRAGTESGYDLNVTTALDDRLTPDVLRGAYRLVVITGNAGTARELFAEATSEGQRFDPDDIGA